MILRIKHYYFWNFCLVLFLTLLLFIFYGKVVTPKISKIARIQVEKTIYEKINEAMYNIKYDEDLINIYKNKNDEIIYVDYNVGKSYDYLKNVSLYLKNNLNSDEIRLSSLGNINNVLIGNIGPKISLQVKYIDSLNSYIYTKVTDYGLNNALLEIYLKIVIKSQILNPLKNESSELEYDLLISSKVVNGKVPTLFDNGLSSSSFNF